MSGHQQHPAFSTVFGKPDFTEYNKWIFQLKNK
jgi:hypothetical protein